MRPRRRSASSGSGPPARLAELTALNALGILLRGTGRADRALGIHRRSERICRDGLPGTSPELLAVYHANALHQLGADLVALDRWADAEPLLRQALAVFEDANMPAWSEPARLDLGIALHRLGRQAQATAVLTLAHHGLTALNHPRRTESAAYLSP
ncbi:tetratricopeptide repeat protein [Kitasatospora sp. NPDC088134]|uniref:tetratricopeptide repeat protein n=1 Tax=Kitasatospora sp. NPDC088134 TaxID=3364071 RepID=UPI003818A6FF